MNPPRRGIDHRMTRDNGNDPIVEAAATWRTRIDAGLTGAEEAQFTAWLAANERHAEIFAQIDDTWALLDRASEVPLEQLGAAPISRLPEVAAEETSRGWRFGWWSAGVAAAILAMVGAVTWRATRGAEPAFAITAASEAGLVKRLNLPDGSIVRLNSDAGIRVVFDGRERRVDLQRGEASFSVAKDSARPFVVTTPGVHVRAIGTVFTVSRNSQSVEVLVTEGKVRVSDAAQGSSLIVPPTPGGADGTAESVPALAAGEKVVIPVRAEVAPTPVAPILLPAEKISQALAWQERRLDFFESTSLAQIAAEFNRFNHHQLVVADSVLAAQRFAGSFRADDPETFLQLIATRAGVILERHPDKTVIRLAK